MLNKLRRKWMSAERTTAKRKYKKLPNRSYGAEEYNTTLKKYSIGAHYQTG